MGTKDHRPAVRASLLSSSAVAAVARADSPEGHRIVRADADEDDDKKDDGDAGAQLKTMINDAARVMDACEKMMDSLGKRMDAMESKVADAMAPPFKKDGDDEDDKKDDEDEEEKKDGDKEPTPPPEPIVADKKKDAAKKDAAKKDEDDDKDKKDDGKHADADLVEMKRQIALLQARDVENARLIERLTATVPKEYSDSDYAALCDAQSAADEVYQAFGKRAPTPRRNESRQQYELRTVRDLKIHSPLYADANPHGAADPKIFEAMRKQVYADALEVARRPASVEPGQMRVRESDRGGHHFREWDGESSSWMQGLAGPASAVTAFEGVNT
jgi:hypothetical protein